MQVVDIYDQANLRHDASCWSIRWSLFERPGKLLIYMIKPLWVSLEIVNIYDKAYLRYDASFW